jgi:hypothetical protein
MGCSILDILAAYIPCIKFLVYCNTGTQGQKVCGGGREGGQFAEHQKNHDQLARSSLAGSRWDRSIGEL